MLTDKPHVVCGLNTLLVPMIAAQYLILLWLKMTSYEAFVSNSQAVIVSIISVFSAVSEWQFLCIQSTKETFN